MPQRTLKKKKKGIWRNAFTAAWATYSKKFSAVLCHPMGFERLFAERGGGSEIKK